MRAIALMLLVLLVAPASALAAAGCPRTSVTDIEDEVMCLQCGVPLAVAEDAPSAKRERAYIQSQIDACKSKQQIKDQLVAQFGSRILAMPKSRSAWLVPVLAFVAGVLAVAFGAYHWRKRRNAHTVAPAGPGLDPGDSARLQADLDRYDL